MLVACIALLPSAGRAHDPSAWGGLFRSRDGGATWLAVDAGSFVSAAVALAINPVSPNHVLLATDSGMWRTTNGGRDWHVEARDVLVGGLYAVVYDADGKRALASASSAMFQADGDRWHVARAPAHAAPARALVRGTASGRVYLAGWQGLYASDDWGISWVRIGDELPSEHVDALVVSPGRPDIVYALAAGQLWVGVDGGRKWQRPTEGLPDGHVETIALDHSDPARVWALGRGQLYRSDDRGERWRPVGRPLPERDVLVRGMAVADRVIVLATDRGVIRSADAGEQWLAMSDGLPAHLEAGPIVRDPHDPSTLYVGFALTPYGELWRRAAEGRTMFAQLELHQLAGGAAFLMLLILGGAAAIRRLAANYRAPRPSNVDPPVTRAAERRGVS